MNTHSNAHYTLHRYRGVRFDRLLLPLVIVLMSPVLILNALLAACYGAPVFTIQTRVDAFGRTVRFKHFRYGIFCKTAVLLDILTGPLAFCGVPMTHRLSYCEQHQFTARYSAPPGLFSEYDVYRALGIRPRMPAALLKRQLNASHIAYLMLFFKGCLCSLIPGHNDVQDTHGNARRARQGIAELLLRTLMLKQAK